MLLYRARREEWEKELRKKHVHKCVFQSHVGAALLLASWLAG